jgi:hypothetical protein
MKNSELARKLEQLSFVFKKVLAARRSYFIVWCFESLQARLWLVRRLWTNVFESRDLALTLSLSQVFITLFQSYCRREVLTVMSRFATDVHTLSITALSRCVHTYTIFQPDAMITNLNSIEVYGTVHGRDTMGFSQLTLSTLWFSASSQTAFRLSTFTYYFFIEWSPFILEIPCGYERFQRLWRYFISWLLDSAPVYVCELERIWTSVFLGLIKWSVVWRRFMSAAADLPWVVTNSISPVAYRVRHSTKISTKILLNSFCIRGGSCYLPLKLSSPSLTFHDPD